MSLFDSSSLLRWGGPQAFRLAKEWAGQGWVTEARVEGTLLRGIVTVGGRKWRGGLKILGRNDVQNLCACAEARRGLICSHSLAIGLATLSVPPSEKNASTASTSDAADQVAPPKSANAPADTLPSPAPRAEDLPKGHSGAWTIFIEGSLREIQVEVRLPRDRVPEDLQAELTALLEECQQAGFNIRSGSPYLRGEREILHFFAGVLPRWEARWPVEVGPRFRHVTRDVVRLRPQVSLADSGEGWLDFRLHYSADAQGVLSSDELRRLLAGGQSAVPLADGRRAVVDPTELDEWEEVLRECDPQKTRGGWRVPARFGGYLEETARSVSTLTTLRDERRGLHSSDTGLTDWSPGPLFSRLRPYQQAGARWLAVGLRAGSGGLLADEMGLGKTVQALALLETLPGRSLVVAPASLVWNWAREAERFCPQLSVHLLTGPDRAKRWQEAPEEGLFLTSYGIVRRDVEILSEQAWSAVVLDEGQHIKNPASQSAQAVRKLRARGRFVLTGTPLENSLGDIWSLYRFLLPGYLGSRQDFQERYERPLALVPSTPVAAAEHRRTWERLKRRLNPFLLRRRKAELLPELPPKIEQVVEIALGPRQRQAYDQLQAAARSQLEEMRGGGTSGATRMKVLTALLRLRQCCCDLRLLGGGSADSPDDDEGKLGALVEILQEAIGGGSRILVFSQFTSMLDLIEPSLTRQGWDFVRLDGTTRDREGAVQRFQSAGGPPIFLISLKAGGVGLNLTAADTVIHYDPWWNPSVEAQATDRAHRLGQQRVVTSIKLISTDTVEQRVLHLQERKRQLGASTLDEDAAWQALSEDELAEVLGGGAESRGRERGG